MEHTKYLVADNTGIWGMGSMQEKSSLIWMIEHEVRQQHRNMNRIFFY